MRGRAHGEKRNHVEIVAPGVSFHKVHGLRHGFAKVSQQLKLRMGREGRKMTPGECKYQLVNMSYAPRYPL